MKFIAKHNVNLLFVEGERREWVEFKKDAKAVNAGDYRVGEKGRAEIPVLGIYEGTDEAIKSFLESKGITCTVTEGGKAPKKTEKVEKVEAVEADAE